MLQHNSKLLVKGDLDPKGAGRALCKDLVLLHCNLGFISVEIRNMNSSTPIYELSEEGLSTGTLL